MCKALVDKKIEDKEMDSWRFTAEVLKQIEFRALSRNS
jgi:hypothetical protein